MKIIGRMVGHILNLLRLKSARCLVGTMFFLGAFAASGRGLWLGLALVSSLVAVVMEIVRRRWIAARIQELPGLSATLEEQELAKRKFLPGHVECPLKPDVLATCALFLPPWDETRARLTTDLGLPGLSTAEEQRRAGLAADERALVFHLETSVKRRLNGFEFQYYLNDFRANRAAKEAQADAVRRAEEAARPIHLADAVQPIAGPVRLSFHLADSVALPRVGVVLEAGDHVGEIRFTHTPPAGDAEWFESEFRCDFTITLADGRRVRAASKVYLPALANLETPEFSEQAVLWRDAPASWREAMDQRCLAGGLQVCDDGRSYFSLFLGGRKHVIHTKYLSYAIDLALDDGGRGVIVRVQGLLAEKWSGDPLSESDRDAELLDFEGVEPFATRVAVERLVPITAPDVHVDATAQHVNDEEQVRYRLVP